MMRSPRVRVSCVHYARDFGRLRQPRFAGRILELRREKANLLGFRNFADLVIDDRYGHSGEAGGEVPAELKEKTEYRIPGGETRNSRVRRTLEGAGAPELAPGTLDIMRRNSVRRSTILTKRRPCGPYSSGVERVIQGMFETVWSSTGFEWSRNRCSGGIRT